MSLGSKKTKVSEAPKIAAPPRITEVTFNSPDGNRYLNRQKGNTLTSETVLNPRTQATVNNSLAGLESLSQELAQPDQKRVEQINNRARDFYELQANAIHAEGDWAREQTKVDLSKRFGGAYNATFGTDLLARLEGNRQSQLYEAGKEAALYAEDLYQQDEGARLNRFQLLNNYLGDLYNQAQGSFSQGGTIVQNENDRIQDLQLKRAQLVQNAQQSNQEAELARRQQRVQIWTALINSGSQIATAKIR